MPKAKAEKQDTAPEQQAVPIVMTLAADVVVVDRTMAGPYSWSKDGAAASTAQWVLPAQDYDVVSSWTLETATGTLPVQDNDVFYTYTTSNQTMLTPKPVWVDDGDGTFSATAASGGRVGHSRLGTPWDVRYLGQTSTFPVTLKAGSTVTLTPVLAAAPPVHTFGTVTPSWARVDWAPAGVRDIEVDGVIVKTQNPGNSITGLAPATTYSTRTRADNPESEWTAAVSLTTLAKYPAPEAPTFTGIAPTEFYVHWTGGSKHNVYVDGVKYGSSAYSGVKVTGRTPGTTYSVTTEQVDGSTAISEKSAAGSVTTTVPPPVPTGVAVSDIEMTGFTASCDVSPGATSYEVRTTEVQGAP